MADYRLSRRARVDLKKIASYSYDNFGVEKARAYLADIYDAFDRLTKHPESGHAFISARPTTLRLVTGSHVICYKLTGYGIYVQRVLHQMQDPLRHL